MRERDFMIVRDTNLTVGGEFVGRSKISVGERWLITSENSVWLIRSYNKNEWMVKSKDSERKYDWGQSILESMIDWSH